MDCKIRSAVAADIATMHRLRCAVRENRLSDPGRISEESYRPYIAAGSAWVAETEELGIAGFAAIHAESATVWALFVDPGCEGAGIGRALHRHMLDWARERGIERLTLSTAPKSRAESFYRRAGWSKTGATAEGELLFERSTQGGVCDGVSDD
jgi:GNAT superfamily N-acetyltransferase